MNVKALVGIGVIVKSLRRFVASFISDCSCSIFSLVSAPRSIVLGWKLQGHRPYLQIDTRYQHTVYSGHTQPFSLNRMSIKTQLNSIVARNSEPKSSVAALGGSFAHLESQTFNSTFASFNIWNILTQFELYKEVIFSFPDVKFE